MSKLVIIVFVTIFAFISDIFLSYLEYIVDCLLIFTWEVLLFASITFILSTSSLFLIMLYAFNLLIFISLLNISGLITLPSLFSGWTGIILKSITFWSDDSLCNKCLNRFEAKLTLSYLDLVDLPRCWYYLLSQLLV